MRKLLLSGAVMALSVAGGFGQELTGDQLRAELRMRGEVPEARALYNQAREAEEHGRDKEAADIYSRLFETYPHMIEALNGLAYLQSTSEDPQVRNPESGVANGEMLLQMALQRWVQRRQYRPPENVKLPFINLPLASSFYKVTILNTLAAAYAASGRFHAPHGIRPATSVSEILPLECAPDATALATMAFENAQALADRYPSKETVQLEKSMEESLKAILAGRSLRGTQLRFNGIS